MSKWLHVNRNKIKPFVVDASYTSRMILDSDFLNEAPVEPIIQINEGTFAPNPDPDKPAEGAAHTADEIYIVLSGHAEITMDGEPIRPEPGDVVYIPAGVNHAVRNLSREEPFRLLTLWKDGRANEMYEVRKNAWGKVFCTVDE